MIESSSTVFHNVKTRTSSYLELEAYKKAVSNYKVKDFSVYTHEARFVKSPAELKLMRDSASIACQVMVVLSFLSGSWVRVVVLTHRGSCFDWTRKSSLWVIEMER